MVLKQEYLHAVWDASLEGKRCWLSDSISELQVLVEDMDYLHDVTKSDLVDYPFMSNDEDRDSFRYAYYDPYVCQVIKEPFLGKVVKIKANLGPVPDARYIVTAENSDRVFLGAVGWVKKEQVEVEVEVEKCGC